MAWIEGRELHYHYWLDLVPVQALQGVSIRVDPSDHLVLCGPSGSGKSTLLALLGLIESPQKGELMMEGSPVASMTEAEKNRLRRFDMGFVFQSFQLFPTLTAAENVEYFLIQQGLGHGERKERVRQALDAVGLWDRRDHRPLELSGGQRQRVALARAAAKRPRLILADEPTASLDQKTGSEIMKVLASLRKSFGTATVVASHDPMVIEEASTQPGSRLMRLRDGREVQS